MCHVPTSSFKTVSSSQWTIAITRPPIVLLHHIRRTAPLTSFGHLSFSRNHLSCSSYPTAPPPPPPLTHPILSFRPYSHSLLAKPSRSTNQKKTKKNFHILVLQCTLTRPTLAVTTSNEIHPLTHTHQQATPFSERSCTNRNTALTFDFSPPIRKHAVIGPIFSLAPLPPPPKNRRCIFAVVCSPCLTTWSVTMLRTQCNVLPCTVIATCEGTCLTPRRDSVIVSYMLYRWLVDITSVHNFLHRKIQVIIRVQCIWIVVLIIPYSCNLATYHVQDIIHWGTCSALLPARFIKMKLDLPSVTARQSDSLACNTKSLFIY